MYGEPLIISARMESGPGALPVLSDLRTILSSDIVKEPSSQLRERGVEITPESTLKTLKNACKLLGVGVTGNKQLLWQRLKKEVAENKLKTMVDILKSIQKDFERDPSGPKPVYELLKKER